MIGLRRRIMKASCAGLAITGALVAISTLAQGTASSVWDGIYTEDQATRGMAAYTAVCATCHGPTLGGVESAPPLTGDLFNANWSGTTVADLAERIRISMPVDKPGSLSRAQLAEIVAYLLKVSGFPAGANPLNPQTVTAAPIRILANRPE